MLTADGKATAVGAVYMSCLVSDMAFCVCVWQECALHCQYRLAPAAGLALCSY